jgi:hypothetical protein
VPGLLRSSVGAVFLGGVTDCAHLGWLSCANSFTRGWGASEHEE